MSERGVEALGTVAALPQEVRDQVLDRMSDGFVRLDGDWRIVYVNRRVADFLGERAEGVQGEVVWDAFPEAEGTDIERGLRESKATGESDGFEAQSEALDIWLQIAVYPDDDGLSVFFRDVREREVAREEVAANEAALTRLHEIAADDDLARDERRRALLELGTERLDLDGGLITETDADGRHTVRAATGAVGGLDTDGEVAGLDQLCAAVATGDSATIVDPAGADWDGDADAGGAGDGVEPAAGVLPDLGLTVAVGVPITVDGEADGALLLVGTADADPERSGDRTRGYDFSTSQRAFLDVLAEWIGTVRRRWASEAALAAERRRLETVTENVPIALVAIDRDGRYTMARGRGLQAVGFEPGAVVGQRVDEVYADYPAVVEAVEAALDGREQHLEVQLDSGVVLEVWLQPVVEDGRVEQAVGVGRDVTEQRKRRETLAGLLDTSRALMDAPTREAVAEIVADAAQDVLGYDLTGVRLFDADSGDLVPAATTAATDDLMPERPVYGVDEGLPGEVFRTGEPRIVEDVADLDGDAEMGAVESAMYQPVGDHGTISVGATDPEAFDESDVQVLALLATAAATACTRASREADLWEARTHTERLIDRLDGLVEDVVEVLVGATTRAEIEAGVAEQLAAADDLAGAWIGRPDLATNVIAEQARAGRLADPPAAIDRDGEGPIARAQREGEPVVVRMLDADRDGPAAALAPPGVAGVIAIPLVSRGTSHGVLAVVADDAAAFDDRERAVLRSLGRAIADAMTAVERGRLLDADSVIEVELDIADEDLPLSRLTREVAGAFDLAGQDVRSDGVVRQFLLAHDVDADAVLEAAASDPGIDDCTCVVEGAEETLFELAADDSLVERLTDFGAAVTGLSAGDGTLRATAELPDQSRARECYELLGASLATVDLVGYHERERPVETRAEFRAAINERLTERQRTALRTAYLGGYFDRPRRLDGDDLAESMDVSRSTVHQHLRAAQRKVLAELFAPREEG